MDGRVISLVDRRESNGVEEVAISKSCDTCERWYMIFMCLENDQIRPFCRLSCVPTGCNERERGQFAFRLPDSTDRSSVTSA